MERIWMPRRDGCNRLYPAFPERGVAEMGRGRGKDLVASPDGFGFENPRIVVEVKRRNHRMGSEKVRSVFPGSRRLAHRA